MINWQYYPKSTQIPAHLERCVEIFENHTPTICSPQHDLSSNEVLGVIRNDLHDLGYQVETGKKRGETIPVPVLFGKNGKLEKSFEADAYHKDSGTVIEVEAGRGVTNNQFLKDFFEACVMHDVIYLVIAVRNVYRDTNDFDKVLSYFDALFASGRLEVPLKGILIIGY